VDKLTEGRIVRYTPTGGGPDQVAIVVRASDNAANLTVFNDRESELVSYRPGVAYAEPIDGVYPGNTWHWPERPAATKPARKAAKKKKKAKK
jgi:hypothetical protein